MPLDQCRQYKPSLYREADFDEFWDSTIAKATSEPINAELIPYVLPTRGVQCYAVRFDGFEGGRIAGWYLRPDARGTFPAVCVYHGYSGRAPRPLDLLAMASQGICVLSMDTRGQNGQSQDTLLVNEGHATGWMSKGIRDPKQYYFRYAYADAVRALELLAQRSEVDASRIAVTGFSQGGALTLAAAALSSRPILCLPDGPFLCDFRRAMQITPAGPYPELVTFLKSFPLLYEEVVRTLSYVDLMNLAPRITAETHVGIFMWDDICPPSTIFAMYNHISAPKQALVYPFHKHEVPYEQNEAKYRLIMETLRP